MAKLEVTLIIATLHTFLLLLLCMGLYHISNVVDKYDAHAKDALLKAVKGGCSFQTKSGMQKFEKRTLEDAVAASSLPDDASENHELFRSLMAKTGTDKLTRHAYDRYYDIYLKDFRDKKGVTILEIGAQAGKSMKLWSSYFSDPAAIHGIAYRSKNDQKKAVCDWNPTACDKITIFYGDQSDPKFLKSLYENYKYDIILDDGSHLPAHQIISLKYLFPALNPGGLYIIEDIETSYWNKPGASVYGYPIPNAGLGASPQSSFVEKMKQLVDVLNRFHMAHPQLHVFPGDEAMFSITFGQGVIIIRKSTEAQMQHIPRVEEALVDHGSIDRWASKAAETNP